MVKIKWRCKNCGQILVSDTKDSHKMDWCKCGKSAVDAEEWYIRLTGHPGIITKIKIVNHKVLKA